MAKTHGIPARSWFYSQSFHSHHEPVSVLIALAPARMRDLTPENRETLCACGVSFRRHFDGWDGTRLDCDEAQRRHGGA